MSEQTNNTTGQSTPGSQKWWKTGPILSTKEPQSRQGQPCPKCYLADLDYDTLFRLSCPNCGYVAECGAFT